MRVIVCGGRDYNDKRAAFGALDAFHRRYVITAVIEGGYRGGDKLARDWAAANGMAPETFMADWTTLGRRAGPVRNRRMRDEGRPDAVVALPGNTGTADMIAAAHEIELPVWQMRGNRLVRVRPR